MQSGTDSRRSAEEIAVDLAFDSVVDLHLLYFGRSASLFRGRQVATQRTVAIKVLHDELSSDTGQRFDRERRVTGQLSGHTGIVPLFDTGTTPDDEPFLIMPFYRRGSLADLMSRYGPLRWREATFLLEPVAVTLAEVNGRELVHRNLKPGNILLTDFLLPRVADFGMCLPIGQESTPATTVAGPYAAPEAATVAPADPATDVFGLGATLWSLLTALEPGANHPDDDAATSGGAGQSDAGTIIDARGLAPAGSPGFNVSEAGVATTSAGGPAPWNPTASLPAETPESLVDLIERSLSADSSRRPDNAGRFVTELRSAVARADRGGVGRRRVELRPDHTDPSLAVDGNGLRAADGDDPHNQASPTALSSGPTPRAADQATNPGPAQSGAVSDRVGDLDDGDPAAERPAVASTEAYLLALVSVITVGILVMVAAAVLAVQ